MKLIRVRKRQILQPKILSITRIWDEAEHNALTDLIYFQDSFFCCFREADQHAGGKDGKIRIISSSDGNQWKSVALLSKKGFDLRDPQLSEMPDGRLMLTMGGSIYEKEKYIGCSPHVAFSDQGTDWSSVTSLKMKDEWIWRVTWHNDTGYGVSYSLTDPSDNKKPWRIKLFRTTDGIKYDFVTELPVSRHPSETTLRFTKSGIMIALVRRWGPAWMGVSKPPYVEWHWFETNRRFSGPNFLILPNGHLWGSGRIFKRENGKRRAKTAMARMTLQRIDPVLIFPSGGDTSYPGMVFQNNKLYISYYSSHEGKAMIYFAVIT